MLKAGKIGRLILPAQVIREVAGYVAFFAVARLPQFFAQVEYLLLRTTFYFLESEFADLVHYRNSDSIYLYLFLEVAVGRSQCFLIGIVFQCLTDFGDDLVFHYSKINWVIPTSTAIYGYTHDTELI